MEILFLEFRDTDEVTVAEIELEDNFGELETMNGYGALGSPEDAVEDLVELFFEVFDDELAADLEDQLIELAEEKGVYV